MHNQSKNTKANKKNKLFVCFLLNNDMMMSAEACSSSSPAEHALVLEKKKKILLKILRIFRQKHLDFHPQISILQSKPKNAPKNT